MKTPIFTVSHLLFGLLAPLAAQNFQEDLTALADGGRPESRSAESLLSPGVVPVTAKAQGSPAEGPALYSAQDNKTLEPRSAKSRGVDVVVDLSVLQNPSPFSNVAAGHPADASGVPTEAVKQDLALISAVYRASGKPESNCQNIALSVEQRIKLDASSILEIVETEVATNPSCACEIVKTAIKASDADTSLVVSIVETSIAAAPATMSIASQCAIAAMPESLAGIQALLAKYDANAGDGGASAKSAKSAKDAKAIMPGAVAAMPNPLDFPGRGPIGPAPGGQPYLAPTPPLVITPPVTEVNP